MELTKVFRAAVVGQEKREQKGNKAFWAYNLRTVLGLSSAMFFDIEGEIMDPNKYPQLGNIIEVKDWNQGARGIIIREFRQLTKEDLIEEELGILEGEKADPQAWQLARDYVFSPNRFENPQFHAFTMECLKKYESAFLECPGAVMVHHNYKGGLLIHTGEVLYYASGNTVMLQRQNGPFLNRDVVVAAAILHDLGKCETYFINNVGGVEKSVAEQMIGHLTYSAARIQEVGAYFDVPKWFVREVLHCVLAHHGRLEWNSVVVPQSLEAWVLHFADMLSSRAGSVMGTLKLKNYSVIENEVLGYDKQFMTQGILNYCDKMKGVVNG
jgi:23S rRNA maturation-related 3'-5' exoribonuclease YhaM